MEFARLLRREQRVSALVNTVLSLGFFLLVFGTAQRRLEMGAPDGFALDFLPQGAAVGLMAALVPALLVRAALLRSRAIGKSDAPLLARIVPAALCGLAAGLASGGLLALAATFGPWRDVAWLLALAVKLGYGAGLGFLVTTQVLTRLYGRASEGCAGEKLS